MKRFIPAAVAAGALLCMTAYADARMLGFGTETPKQFIDKAAASDEFEVQSSKVALEKAQNAEVKVFAQKMIDEHGATTAKLKVIIAAQNLAAPADPLDSSQKSMIDKLKTADVSDFDRLYLKDQRNGHEDTEELMDRYATNGDNEALKQFAAQTLPAVKEHLAMVEDMRKRQKVASAQ